MTFQTLQADRRPYMRGRNFDGAIALVILTRGVGSTCACWEENEAATAAFLQHPDATRGAKRAMLEALRNPERRSAPSPTTAHARVYGVLVYHYDGDYQAALEALASSGLWFWRHVELSDQAGA